MALYNSRGNLNVSAGSGVGRFTNDGKMRITEVSGSSWTGLYAANGSLNVVLVSSSATPQGMYHACGALRVVEATSEIGVFAPNGAFYVSGTSGGVGSGDGLDFSNEINSQYLAILEEF